jgi:chloride channel protein, CIC family
MKASSRFPLRTRVSSVMQSVLRKVTTLSDVHSMLFWAVVVGIAGAYATASFREGVELLQRCAGGTPGDFVAMARGFPWPLRASLPAVGGLTAGICLVLAKRHRSKFGTDYMEAVTSGDGIVPIWQSIWRSLSSLLSIASGGSIGREGSMIQLAALCSSCLGRGLRFDPIRLRMLVACGAAAGITSAYSAPIAGAFFVTELVLGSMVMEWFGPILISSVVANITMREFAGYRPTYEMPAFPAITGFEVLPFIVLGLLCGLLAPRFLRLLSLSKTLFGTFNLPLPLRLSLGGFVVGLISVWEPEVWGNGYEVVNSLLHQPWTWDALALVLVLKVLATFATVGSGAVGGVFTPTLFVGAVLGCLFGNGMHELWPGLSTGSFAYAVVGMGAFLAAATNAPLMSILMIFEMTLSYQVVLPLMLASVIAYFVARNAEHTSMYEVTVKRTREQKDRRKLATLRMEHLLKPAETVVTLDTPIEALTKIFINHAVKYIYVVDATSIFRGVVALDALAADLVVGGNPQKTIAAAYLLPDFRVLTPEMTISEALGHFLSFRGERLPVVDGEGQFVLLGVVYKTALLEAYVKLSSSVM